MKENGTKTPGGISKSLLTPCRRLGLSRKWKMKGPSPFVSPLTKTDETSNTPDIKDLPKRKKRIIESDTVTETVLSPDKHNISQDNSSFTEKLPDTPLVSNTSKRVNKRLKYSEDVVFKNCDDNNMLVKPDTPHVANSSKRLNKKLNYTEDTVPQKSDENNMLLENKNMIENYCFQGKNIENFNCKNDVINITSLDEHIPANSVTPENSNDLILNNKSDSIDCPNNTGSINQLASLKANLPNDLSKECFVVIQKKLFKTDKNNLKDELNGKDSKDKLELDLDDVPLINIKQKSQNINEDENFVDKKTKNVKVKKLEHKNTSTTDLKSKIVRNKVNRIEKNISEIQFLEDDDDFDLTKNIRTIVVKKSYDKVVKPSKAKSTGSISQRDIDELRNNIEIKKKLLLARSMKDTEDLRNLIKRWQKGCQDALIELMDLLKIKFPDKQNTYYSDILKMLNIPCNLVGYDSDNDCFVTPNDDTLLLDN